MAIDRERGDVVWERVAREEVPHEGHQPNGTYASGSAVTDGEHLFAFFGSWGLYAYDLEGNLQWEVDLGTRLMRNAFGEGTTPALHGDTLVVTWDHIGGQSFIVALDKHTGEERWRANRDEIDTWATPLIVEHDGRVQVIVNATNMIRSYDLSDGSLVWECGGMTANAIPSPVHADGTVYVMSGFRGSALFAIDLDRAAGDITGSDAIMWEKSRDTPYVPSPLLTEDTLYYVKGNDGMLSAVDASTGKALFPLQRLEGIGGVYSSPVAADGRVYLADREGATVVLDGGADFTVLATNQLDDRFSSTPALVDGEIYLRGERFVYCIAAD